MIQRRTFPLVALILLVLVIVPTLVFGAGMPGSIVTCSGAVDANVSNPADTSGQKACSVCDIAQVAQNILNTGIYVAVFLSAILFAWAGWLYLTSFSNEGKISEAKSIFGNVIIGLIIILAGWLIIDTLMKTLVPQTGGFGPWNEVCRRSA